MDLRTGYFLHISGGQSRALFAGACNLNRCNQQAQYDERAKNSFPGHHPRNHRNCNGSDLQVCGKATVSIRHKLSRDSRECRENPVSLPRSELQPQ